MSILQSATSVGRKVGSWAVGAARTRRARRLLWGALAALLLFGLLGFLAVPPLLKGYLVRTLSEKLHRPVSIRQVRFNPFTLTATLSGCQIMDRDGSSPFLSFDSLVLDASAWSLPERGAVLDAIVLKGLRLNLVRNEDGTYNVSDLLKPAPGKPSSPAPRYSLNNIRVVDSEVTFDDRPAGARHEVTRLNVAIPFLSNLPSKVNVYTAPSLSARVDGEEVELHGETKPFSPSRETFLSVRMKGMDLAHYLPYLPADLSFKVTSGSLDTALRLTFLEERGGRRKLILSGDAALSGFAADLKDGSPLARLPRVSVSVGSVDLFTLRGVVTSVRLDRPELFVSRDAKGVWNLARLAEAGDGPGAKTAQKGRPAAAGDGAKLLVGEVGLDGGTVHLQDGAVRPAFRATLSPFDLTVQDLDTALTSPARAEVSLTTDEGEQVQGAATIAFAPLKVEGQFRTAGLRLARYTPYDRDLLPFEVRDGRLDFSGTCAYSGGARGGLQLSGGALKASGLSLRLPGEKEDFLALPSAEASGLSFDTSASQARIASLGAEGGSLRAVRAADGALDLGRLAGGPSGAAGAPPATTAPAGPPWTVTLDSVQWKGFALRVEDRSLPEPASFDFPSVAFEGRGLSTAPGQRGSVSLSASMKPSGRISLSGPFALAPVSLDWQASVERLSLLPFEPYLTGALAIQLTAGEASAKGRVSAALPAGKPLQASFQGEARVDGLSTVDKATLEKFVDWKSLQLGGVKAQADPPSLAVASVALSDFYARLIVSPQGKLNLFQMLHPNAPPAEAAPGPQAGGEEGAAETTAGEEPAPTEPPPSASAEASSGEAVEIPSVTLSGGTLDYTDHFIKPNYSAKLTEVVGSLTGLSSRPGTRADLKLSAHLDHQAPIEVAGKINPLVKPAYADIQGKVTDVELSPLSPYSGRYAGYLIEKGKLNMDVSYKVENGHLQAENHLFLDQFDFGSKVDSPEATKLPVRLAVALLKDREGRIDLRIPVSGSLNDPKFKIGRIILKIILNLLAKAATSPFALLGHLFGHGESLSYVTFAPGSAALDAAALQKVQQLETALYDRPALKLDITGRFDPAADEEGLRRAFVEREVKAQKFKELMKKGQAPASVEDAVVTKEEYSEDLFRAYKQAKFPKARTVIGMVKRLPDDEMERLLLLHTTVTKEDLERLAQARAEAVKEALLKSGRVSAQRVFLATGGAASEEAKKAGLARVDFSLK